LEIRLLDKGEDNTSEEFRNPNTLAESLRVAKLLDTERGARVRGFADSIARNAERRMFPFSLNTRNVPGEFKQGVLHTFLRDLV
jgi:hypothetical protein